MNVLHIYIIEDDIRKKERMESYFNMMNEILKNKCKRDTEEVDKEQSERWENELITFLLKQKFESIECHAILPIPEIKYDFRYEYCFKEGGELQREIERILSKEEKRVFFIDLALNSTECDVFSRKSEVFRAHTASKICETIAKGGKVESIILNTRCINVQQKWKRLLSIDRKLQNYLKIESIQADTFSFTTPRSQRDILIYEAIEGCL